MAAEYRQVILAFDQDAATVRFYLSAADHGGRNGTWDFIAEKGYSGGAIDRVSVRTTTAGTVYADMVQVFVPGTFILGDSISDGKPNWSEQPNYTTDAGGAHGRLGPNEDETNAPAYQLGLLTGEHVAARGFGAANSTQVINGVGTGEGLEGLFLDQHGQEVVFYIGHNDLYGASSSATLKANVATILGLLVAGGIDPGQVTFCKIAPSDLFDGSPSGDEDRRIEYNAWLTDFCARNGCRLAFASEALNDNTKTTAYKRLDPAYDVGDGTHLNVAGDVVLAREMHRARVPGGVLRRAGGGLVPASFLTDSPAVARLLGAAFALRSARRPSAAARYAVSGTPAANAKPVAYRVATTPSVAARGLAYAVAPATSVQAGATYAVVTSAVGPGPSARYAVAMTPAASATDLAYEVAPPPGRISRALAYAVRAAGPGGATGAGYNVRTTPAPIAKALGYEIDATATVGVSRALGYRVRSAPAGARGLTYRVGYPAREVYRAVVVAPEPHAVSVPPETHTVEVRE